MSAKILLFSPATRRFVPRVEVREHWSRDGSLCWWRVVALHAEGIDVLDSFPDPDEAEDFADGFRLAHREEFARDIARHGGARRERAPAPWWLSDEREQQASHDLPPDSWDDHGGAA